MVFQLYRIDDPIDELIKSIINNQLKHSKLGQNIDYYE